MRASGAPEWHEWCISRRVANSLSLSQTLFTSAVTTAATTAALFALSKKDTGHPAAALNATSHILWGNDATQHDAWDVRHTLAGVLLNAGAMGAWSLVQGLLPAPHSLFTAARNGATVTALAYATDYHLVPKRLTPGFEQRLSRKSLLTSYAVLAAALTAAGYVLRRRE